MTGNLEVGVCKIIGEICISYILKKSISLIGFLKRKCPYFFL